MTALTEVGVILTIVGALVTFYVNLNKRIDQTASDMEAEHSELEDCVEGKIGELTKEFSSFRESQHAWCTKVVERLTAIETHLKGGIGCEKG